MFIIENVRGVTTWTRLARGDIHELKSTRTTRECSASSLPCLDVAAWLRSRFLWQTMHAVTRTQL